LFHLLISYSFPLYRILFCPSNQIWGIAAELGICIDTLKSWLKAAGVHPGSAERENRDLRRLRELETEVKTLRKQVAEKDEVIDVLKKSVGILSKP